MMDDLVPQGFLLILRDAPQAAQLHQWADPLAALNAQIVCIGANAPDVLNLIETDDVLARWFARNECTAALARPDHIVFGVAGSSTQTGSLLTRACHQMGLKLATAAIE